MNCHFCHHPCYLSSYKHLYLIQRLVQVFIFPFLWECSRTGIWIEYIGTSGQCWEIIHPKAWVSLQRCGPTVLFITDAVSYHQRSCHAALWLLPHLQLRRVLICLDVVYQAHTHEAGVSVSCHYPSDIRPPSTASLPIYSIHYLQQWNKLLWYELSESLVSVALFHRLHWSVNSFYFLRIHWGAQGSISTTACRQVLCQGG